MHINYKNLTVWGIAGSASVLSVLPAGAVPSGPFQHTTNRLQDTASAPEEYQTFEHEDLIYRVLSERQVEVMAVRSMDFKELEIPASIQVDGAVYTPVKIASMVFMGMQDLEKVTLPSTMQEVAQAAFISCPKLKEVWFSKESANAVLIKSGAFENCPKLTSVVLPDQEVSMEKQVFNGTQSVSLYRWSLDTSVDLGGYAGLYMGLYDNRAAVQKVSDPSAPESYDPDAPAPVPSTSMTTGDSSANTGWLLKNNQYMYLVNGRLVKSTFQEILDRMYYFDEQGYMVRGWKDISGKSYYFFENGVMAINTEVDGRYLDANGVAVQYDWIKLGSKWKFGTSVDTCLRSTFQTINQELYYFDSTGIMKTGWFTVNGASYYARNDGSIAKNTYVGSYYVDHTGKWDSSLDKPQWIKQQSKWWYRHAGGTCTRGGWEIIDDEEYYFDEEGWMQTGWIAVNGKWYYCKATGEKVKDSWIGKYYLDENGIWNDSEWISTRAGKMYRYSDGTFALGWKTINGKRYYFSEQGYLQTGWQTIGGKLYYLNPEGNGGELSNASRYVKTNGQWSYNARHNLHGVDISHWQDGINAAALPGDFIIAKATGGKGFLDASFHEYARAAQASGKLFGMYHFARDNGYKGDPEEEAEFFYSVVKDYIGWAIPILDWETDLDLGPAWVEKFLNRFYELSGVKCMVYTSAYVTRGYDWSRISFKGHVLWMAQYANMEDVIGFDESPWRDAWGCGAFHGVRMHQYTSRGRLPGYNGALDMNIFYGTREDWSRLAKKS